MTQPRTLRMRAVRLLILATLVFVIGRVAERARVGATAEEFVATEAIAAAAGASLLLAAALWRWATPVILLAATEFAFVFAALDLRELLHQLHASRHAVAALALLAATLHGGTAVLAGRARLLHGAQSSVSRRYGQAARREQDWLTGSLAGLVTVRQQGHWQEGPEQGRPIGQNGHQIPGVPKDGQPPLPRP